MLGWNPGTEEEYFTLEDLVQKFTPERINRSNSIFTIAKLTWMNNLHIRAMNFEDFHKKAQNYYCSGLKAELDIEKISRLIQERLDTFNQITEKTDFFTGVKEYDISLYDNKKMKSDPGSAKIMLENIIPLFESITDWNNETVYGAMNELIQKEGCKSGAVLWPVRIALSGKLSTPGGASEIADIIGKKETIARVRAAADLLGS
jgi:glutamyl/glutaminyl-tRNA synthetase